MNARTALSWVGPEAYYSRVTPIVQRTTDPYALVDLSVSKALLNSHHVITVGVDNAFDTYREAPYGMPQAGRAIYLRLRSKL